MVLATSLGLRVTAEEASVDRGVKLTVLTAQSPSGGFGGMVTAKVVRVYSEM